MATTPAVAVWTACRTWVEVSFKFVRALAGRFYTESTSYMGLGGSSLLGDEKAKLVESPHAHTAHIDRRTPYLCKVLHIEKKGARMRGNTHYKYMSYRRRTHRTLALGVQG
jgi:hypothetical protein